MSQSEGKSAGASYVEEVHSVRKPTFAGKLKAHLRKWWWAHLIVFLLSTLTISLLLSVIFPALEFGLGVLRKIESMGRIPGNHADFRSVYMLRSPASLKTVSTNLL